MLNSTLYMTLWSVVTAINEVEGNSCTLQVIREANHTKYNSYHYDNIKDSELMEFAVALTETKSMPLLVVDLYPDNRDKYFDDLFNSLKLQIRFM